MERRCETCAFFHAPDGETFSVGPVKIGSCRRRAPALGRVNDYDMWPLVTPGAWCGEYEAAPERGA